MLGLLFFFTKLYMIKYGNIFGFIGAFTSSFLIGFLICLKNEYKVAILLFLSKAFALFLCVSMGFWVLYLAGVPLPNSTIVFRDVTVYHNYYLFTVEPRHVVLDIIPRFSSVFLEPGHLGMITPFLLFIYRFDFKKTETIVFFAATLLSFSLAGYIITLIAAALVLLTNSRKQIFYLITFIILLASGYFLVTTYNDGDNAINQYIIIRLEYDHERERIAGYNFHSDDLAQYFENFIKTDKALFGIGYTEFSQRFWAGAGSGYKRLIIIHGFIGAFLFYFFYFAITLKHKSLVTFMFLLVLVVTSIQRVWMYWEAVLMVFITGLAYLDSMNRKRRHL